MPVAMYRHVCPQAYVGAHSRDATLGEEIINEIRSQRHDAGIL